MPESTAKKAAVNKSPAKKSPAKKSPTTASTAGKQTATASASKAARAKTSKAATAAKTGRTAKTAKTAKTGKNATRTGTPRRLAVREDESPWTAAELADVRRELQADAERLRSELAITESEIADLLRDGSDGAGNDQADVGSNTLERDHEMSLANNWRDMLQQVEHALQRIEDGSYGECERCGNPIGKMRLMAFPRATLCLSCKQREERR